MDYVANLMPWFKYISHPELIFPKINSCVSNYVQYSIVARYL